MRWRGGTVLAAILALVASCADDGAPNADYDVDPPDFEPDVVEVFENNCSCHLEDAEGTTLAEQEGPVPVGSHLRLDLEGAHAELVGVASEQAEGMARVTPDDLDDSYLWRKLNGTHESAGGSGSEMPPGEELSDEALETIRHWIEDGAPN